MHIHKWQPCPFQGSSWSSCCSSSRADPTVLLATASPLTQQSPLLVDQAFKPQLAFCLTINVSICSPCLIGSVFLSVGAINPLLFLISSSSLSLHCCFSCLQLSSSETSIDIYTLSYAKQIASRNLLYSSGSSASCSGMTYRGGGEEG